MPETPVLQIDSLSKAFDGTRALRNAHLELLPGEIHALVGENGAGKSTLIKILAGIHARDGGHIRIDGQEVEIATPAASQELGIAVIFQDFDLPPNLSVADALLLGREPTWPFGFIKFGERNQLAAQYLENVGLELDTGFPVQSLSVAERQLLAIARAISSDARILIMDEPTSSLARDEIENLLSLVKRLKQAGTAVIYISHKLDEVFRIADRVTVFRDGETIGTRDAAATTEDAIVTMMVGRNLDDLYSRTGRPQDETLLEVKGIRKEGVFNDTGFALRKGEVLGLYGLKGAGRSEMMRALFGLDSLDDGEVHLEGRRVDLSSPSHAIASGIAYVPEDRQTQGIFPNMSVKENMSIVSIDGLGEHGFINHVRERRVIRDFITRLNIRIADMNQPILSLSGGNQQKVILARWLIGNPKVLVLDEPTTGVDVGARSEIYRFINALAADGMGVILVSSELLEILGMSDRILVMHEGGVVGEFTRQGATEEAIMRAIYA